MPQRANSEPSSFTHEISVRPEPQSAPCWGRAAPAARHDLRDRELRARSWFGAYIYGL